MLRVFVRWLHFLVSVSGYLAHRRSGPGWRVQGEMREPAPVPVVPAMPLPEGMTCPWGLGCRCGLCLRDVPPTFASRIADPTAPRAWFL
jgi:hypothetical protein